MAGIAGSIGTVGDALHNALCESTIRLFKTEAIHDGGPIWKSRAEVEWQVSAWVRWHNHHQLHSAVGHLPPLEFEQTHRQAKTVVPVPEAAQPPTLRETQGGSLRAQPGMRVGSRLRRPPSDVDGVDPSETTVGCIDLLTEPALRGSW